MIFMNAFYDDQRISGYLDGELSADEQSRFEEEIAQNAELRQVVDELRALRSDLDLLPRARLEEDFAARVLRRAEREVLSGGLTAPPVDDATPNTEKTSVAQNTPAYRSTWSRERFTRPLIWSAAAIAAGLIVMALTHEPANNDQVARLGERRTEQSPVADNHRALPPAQISAPPGILAKSEKPGDGKQPAAKSLAYSSNTKSSVAKPSDESFAAAEKSKAVELKKDQGQHPQPAAGSIAADERREIAPRTPSESIAPHGLQFSSEKSRVEDVADQAKPQSQAASDADAASARAAGAGRRLSPEPIKFAHTPNAWKTRSPMSTEIARMVTRWPRAGPDSAKVIVVACDSTRSATNDEFRATLMHHGIEWRDDSTGDTSGRRADFGTATAREPVIARQKLEPKADSPAIADAPAAPAADPALAAATDKSAPTTKHGPPSQVSVIYVEATPEQLRALIHDLQAEPTVYRDLIVSAPFESRPTDGVEQGVAGAGSAVGGRARTAARAKIARRGELWLSKRARSKARRRHRRPSPRRPQSQAQPRRPICKPAIPCWKNRLMGPATARS